MNKDRLFEFKSAALGNIGLWENTLSDMPSSVCSSRKQENKEHGDKFFHGIAFQKRLPISLIFLIYITKQVAENRAENLAVKRR